MALRKGEKRMTYEEAKQKLMPVGQEHLLQYFEELGEEEKKSLLKQIEDLDLSLLNLIEGGVKEIPKGKLEPLGAVTLARRLRQRESIMKKSDCRQFMTAKWVRFFWQADREQDLVWISQKEC